jgi:uncharacterized repeat protein (TIGR01451 family)
MALSIRQKKRKVVSFMRLVYLATFLLLLLSAYAKEDDEVTFEDFTLSIGDRIEIGNYRIVFIDVQSEKDGLAILKISKMDGTLDEQRVMLEDNANTFDGGAEERGITITVEDILDDQSAKVMLEYDKDIGTPKKRISTGPKIAKDAPNLIVEKRFDKERLAVGEDIKAIVTVKNVGTGTASDIQLNDLPPLSEFTYEAGYPPKIKDKLEPGESDSAIYVMNAVKDGSIKVPSIQVNYVDSKKSQKSNISATLNLVIDPRGKPELNIEMVPSGPVPEEGRGLINISIANAGRVPATKIQIQSEIKPSAGLETIGLDRTFFEIIPGGEESYSAQLVGKKSGNYSVILRATYSDGDESMLKEEQTKIVVLEREYKYLYLLVIIPIIAIVVWMIKRYREYKY